MNAALADLDATALKSVVDLLRAAGLVVIIGVSLTGVGMAGRELVCELRFRSAGGESKTLVLDCCPPPLLSGALQINTNRCIEHTGTQFGVKAWLEF